MLFNRRMRKTACPVVWKGTGRNPRCPIRSYGRLKPERRTYGRLKIVLLFYKSETRRVSFSAAGPFARSGQADYTYRLYIILLALHTRRRFRFSLDWRGQVAKTADGEKPWHWLSLHG